MKLNLIKKTTTALLISITAIVLQADTNVYTGLRCQLIDKDFERNRLIVKYKLLPKVKDLKTQSEDLCIFFKAAKSNYVYLTDKKKYSLNEVIIKLEKIVSRCEDVIAIKNNTENCSFKEMTAFIQEATKKIDEAISEFMDLNYQSDTEEFMNMLKEMKKALENFKNQITAEEETMQKRLKEERKEKQKAILEAISKRYYEDENGKIKKRNEL